MKSSSSLQVGGVVGEEDDDGRGFRVLQRIRRRNECWSRHGRRRPPFRYRQGYSFYNIPISIFCFVTTSVFRPITCSCGFCLITDALVGIKTISCFSFYHWIGILMLPLLGGKDWLIDWFFVGCFVSCVRWSFRNITQMWKVSDTKTVCIVLQGSSKLKEYVSPSLSCYVMSLYLPYWKQM